MRKYSYGVIIFAAYSFLLTMTLQLNDEVLLTGVLNHYFGSFMLGLGFLLFYLSRVVFPDAGKRKIAIIAATTVYAASVIIRLTHEFGIFTVLISALAVGYLGGMVYYNLAAACSINGKSGLVLSLGATIAFGLQYMLQGMLLNRLFIYIILFLGALVMLMTAFVPLGDFTLESVLPYAEETDEWKDYLKKDLILRTAISLCILAVMVLCEVSYISDTTSSLNLYGIARLLIPVGYFVIGIAYDLRGYKFAQFIMISLSVFSVVARAGSDYVTLRICLFYLLVGGTIAYITLGFWDIAPKTKHPDLWAIFGRIISITESLMVVFLIKVDNSGYFLTMLLTAVLLAITVFLVLMENALKEPEWEIPKNSTNLIVEGAAEEEIGTIAAAVDVFDAFAGYYRLTPREREVMYTILHSDDKIKTIASEIGLSDRMVYRYMNQLYEKMGTENRAGLMKVYFDFESKYSS